MIESLTYQRCFNHVQREAVARCPVCNQHFCRECITEHDDRVICAACLRKLLPVPLLQRRGFASLIRFCQFMLGVLAAWFFFYLIGESLVSLPGSFHEKTLWQAGWLDRE